MVTIIRVMVMNIIWATARYVLLRFEYLTAFSRIDNTIGMLPVVMALTVSMGVSIIIWTPRKEWKTPVTAAIALLVILSAALFPTALRGNWWINTSAPEGMEATPDLTVYIPFSEGAMTVKLDEEAALRIIENQPKLDGATALYPVYAAFAEAVYDEAAFSQDTVRCTNTQGAYEAILAGERDVIFVASASERQISAARAAGVDLWFTPIGREAFVFLVGSENPVDNITFQEIRNIYSGKTAYWSTLGWQEGG